MARRWRWRKVLRGEPVPEGWRDLNGETGRAMANRDPNENDPGLYPVAPSSDSGVRVVLGDEGAGSEVKSRVFWRVLLASVRGYIIREAFLSL